MAWAFIRLLALAALPLGGLLAFNRRRFRREREMQRVLITPGRSSEASPAQVASLIEALCTVTRERWWVRLWRGPRRWRRSS